MYAIRSYYDVHLLEDPGLVGAHGVDAQAQFVGDGFGFLAGHQQMEDLELAVGEGLVRKFFRNNFV